MIQKYTSIAICYLLASSGVVVSANNHNDRTAELYNNNNANGISNERVNDERGNNGRRSFLNLGRRHFNHRTLLSNNNKQQDTFDRSLQVDEATLLEEAQTAKVEAEQIMLSSSPEAQQAISQTISDIQTNPDLSPSEKEEMLKLLKVEATEAQSQVMEDESHINTSKKKKMVKLNEEINNVEIVKDELDVAIQQVEQEEVIKETLLKGTEGQTFNNNNLSQPTSDGDKKYPTEAPSTIGIAGGGGGGAYMTTEEPTTYSPSYPTYSPYVAGETPSYSPFIFVPGETPTYSPSLPEPTYSPTELEPTMSPSPSSSSSGSSSHSPSPSHDTLTTS